MAKAIYRVQATLSIHVQPNTREVIIDSINADSLIRQRSYTKPFMIETSTDQPAFVRVIKSSKVSAV